MEVGGKRNRVPALGLIALTALQGAGERGGRGRMGQVGTVRSMEKRISWGNKTNHLALPCSISFRASNVLLGPQFSYPSTVETGGFVLLKEWLH